MLPFIIPALIAGIGGIASTALQNSANRKAQDSQNILNAQQSDKQFEYSKEQAETQYQNDLKTMAQQREWDLEDRQFAIDNPTVIKGEVDYEQMIKSATAAGINPLTALRNGGSAGFSASSQPSAPLSRTAPTRHAALRHAPQQGVAAQNSALGAGIGAGVDRFLQDFDPFADSKRELEQQLVTAQIANLNASSSAMRNPMRPQSFNVPSRTAGTIERRPSGAAAQLSNVVTGDPQAVVAGQPSVTNPHETAKIDPRVRDSEVWATRYGDSEIGQMLYGIHVGAADLAANYPKWDMRNYTNPTPRDLLDAGYKYWQKLANDDYDKTNRARAGGGGGGW